MVICDEHELTFHRGWLNFMHRFECQDIIVESKQNMTASSDEGDQGERDVLLGDWKVPKVMPMPWARYNNRLAKLIP
jgi:hypothetical protein